MMWWLTNPRKSPDIVTFKNIEQSWSMVFVFPPSNNLIWLIKTDVIFPTWRMKILNIFQDF